MSSQDIILGARVQHLRELKTCVAALKAENAKLRDELATLESHFSLALTAADDLRALSLNGKFYLWDAWNLILSADKKASSPENLISLAREHLAKNKEDFIWIIFDGHKENDFNEPRLRISYTGGIGPQRADRMILDFIRMAHRRGDSNRIILCSADKALVKKAREFL